ncbi:peptide chain release factor N(5)-glutamine methyltransferase [Anaerobiospirillum sp. NML120449]|uniref:peptide chain release factor N(5)-glutamine methyltransferase n=1 Tax=Anaerobiospirillum sp. NML120449 TaxID=2932817 RepID=UPI001FF2D1D7|nr:peptide chain release factor N(5)-glutamine methyltransferase [Anaerobiospirillum sp. NML120449]MCK0525872.1 peptide chain release factor N(5)-glutamine methyltransferase [Anaerobiospirillum sp. NML120449]
MIIRELLRKGVEELKAAGSESYRLDAVLLLMKACNLSRVQVITMDDSEVDPDRAQEFERLISARAKGHPVAHLLGERDFWELTLKVNEHTLIPRPDTEVLVEQALKTVSSHDFGPAPRVLDLGTGSGAIILSIKHSAGHIIASAVERSAQALEVARENARLNNLEVHFYEGSWFEPLPQGSCFDLIVSNPPYIEEHDPHLTQGDVRFEPLTALVSGQDGLDDIRHIADKAGQYLVKGGYLLFEHGYNQAEAVRAVLSSSGFDNVSTVKDLGGNDRVTMGQLR